MFLPRPVYRTLPTLYLCGGLLSVSLLDGPRALLAGLLLTAAGMRVLQMRRSARRGRVPSRG